MEFTVCDIASIAGVLILLVHSVAYNIRRSRCVDVDCFCVKCKRDLMTVEELKNDLVVPSNVNQV